jgi:hypothetical protein
MPIPITNHSKIRIRIPILCTINGKIIAYLSISSNFKLYYFSFSRVEEKNEKKRRVCVQQMHKNLFSTKRSDETHED